MHRRSSRAFIFIGLCTCLSGGCSHRGPDAVDPSGPPDGHLSTNADVTKERARELIENEHFEQAVKLLTKLRPSEDPEIDELWTVAQNEQRAKAALVTACLETDSREIETVYDHCWLIPETSRYANKGCCTTASERFAEDALKRASEALRLGEASAAYALAQLIVADTKIPEALRTRARRTAAHAEKRVHRHGSRDTSDDAEQAYEIAKAHIAGEDYERCIEVLTAAPQDERVVRVLITCYQKSGKLRAACLLARQHDDLTSARGFIEMRCPE